MPTTLKSHYLAVLLGGLTFILFATQPYILDMVAPIPTRSIGQIIGDNARDLLNGLNGQQNPSNAPAHRATWSNALAVLAFVLFVLSIIAAAATLQDQRRRWYGAAGGLLALTGLGIYLSHLALGLIGFIVIAVLVVTIIGFLGG